VRHLKELENAELLDLQLNMSNNMPTRHLNQVTSNNTHIYEVGDAKPFVDPFLRAYLLSKKIPEEKLTSAMEQYSRNVLLLSQRGLQNAYALHRLGGVFSNSDMTSIDLITRRRWTEMVDKHSEDLNNELRSLSEQLVLIDPEFHNSNPDQIFPIEDGERFIEETDELLNQMQEVNRVLGVLFTANATSTNQDTPHSLLEKGLSAVPLLQAEEINRFASKLRNSERAQSKTFTGDESIGQTPEQQ
jgi:hypothetical protein